MIKNPLLIVLGPTASGKTRLAVQLAYALNGEVISADSRQVFKGMDIGTGKDLEEYKIGTQSIPYHLIDIKEAGERYQVNAFKEDFYAVFNKLNAQKKMPILCGGTGMYIHSILQRHELTSVPVNHDLRSSLPDHDIYELRRILSNYPLEVTSHADQSSVKRLIRAIEVAEYLKYNKLADEVRPAIHPLVIGLTADLEIRRKKILDRLELRLKNGIIDEVVTLLKNGVSKEMLTFYGLEYKFIVSYLSNEINLNELKEHLFIAICQYAKRQMTFFRKMEKDGVEIHWFSADQGEKERLKDILDLSKKSFSANN